MYEHYIKRYDSLAGTPAAPAPAEPPAALRAPGRQTPRPAVARVLNPMRPSFETRRQDYAARLGQINAQLAQVQCGPLVAVPISVQARQPGPLAEFLLDIGANPFDRWNMLYYVADKPSADLMDALHFTSEVEGQFDAKATARLEEARAEWEAFASSAAAESEEAVHNHVDTLKRAIIERGGEVGAAVYDGKLSRWRHFFGEKVDESRPSAPPAAPAVDCIAYAPGSVLERITSEGRIAYDEAKARGVELLENINSQLPTDCALVPMPLCRAAVWPGALAEFLLDIGADPFQRWNTICLAADQRSEMITDTPQRVEGAEVVDAELRAMIGEMKSAWEAFRAHPAAQDAMKARAYRDTLRVTLAQESRKLEAPLLAGHKHSWRSMFGESIG